MHHPSDTIAAIATPPGLGGIAILRLSGAGASLVLRRLFKPHAKQGGLFRFIPRHMHYGQALDKTGERLDDVLAVFMPGPHSATGEDVGEIHCHGGPGITAALLEAALEAGARIAGPGEFTRRAFLNGRMDLTQAEAVAEMISAPTREGARLAAAKLDGALGREVGRIRSALDALRMQVTLAVDFPDEEAELLSRDAFRETLRESMHALRRLLEGFERARLWREGALAVLAGRVNAGKSSLLNALLGRERAIVSDCPGTTRDYLEESINIKGMYLRLVDTAGLRQGGDLVEEEGIRRSRDLADEADVLLFVIDAAALFSAQNTGLREEERDFLRKRAHLIREGRLLVILNKMDMLYPGSSAATSGGVESDFEEAAARSREAALAALAAAVPLEEGLWSRCPCFPLSAGKGLGIDAMALGLRETLAHMGGGNVPAGDIAPNVRQSGLLKTALGELESLARALAEGCPPDILGVHLEAGADSLADVTGASSTEELLDSIFSSFCIGK